MITAAVCTSYRREILSGVHKPDHSYKLALFTKDAELNGATSTYAGQKGEAAGKGYDKGGKELTGFATGDDAQRSIAWVNWPGDVVWQAATLTVRGALIYNDSLPGKNAVAILDFGADKTATNGPFKVTMPASTADAALIRIKY